MESVVTVVESFFDKECDLADVSTDNGPSVDRGSPCGTVNVGDCSISNFFGGGLESVDASIDMSCGGGGTSPKKITDSEDEERVSVIDVTTCGDGCHDEELDVNTEGCEWDVIFLYGVHIGVVVV